MGSRRRKFFKFFVEKITYNILNSCNLVKCCRIKQQNQMLADRLATDYLADNCMQKMVRLANAFDNAFNVPLRKLDFGAEDIQRMKDMRNKPNPLLRYVTHKVSPHEFSEINLPDADIPNVTRQHVRAFMTGVQGLRLAPYYIQHTGMFSYFVSSKRKRLFLVTGWFSFGILRLLMGLLSCFFTLGFAVVCLFVHRKPCRNNLQKPKLPLFPGVWGRWGYFKDWCISPTISPVGEKSDAMNMLQSRVTPPLPTSFLIKF